MSTPPEPGDADRRDAAAVPATTAEPSARTTDPATAAGGLPAVFSIARHSLDKVAPWTALALLARANQHDGFDCPGCAWPDPARPGQLEFCENGAKAIVDEATRRRADPAFFAAHTIHELGARSDRELNRAGRLTHPMIREPGTDRYVPLSWDDAFARIAEHLHALDHPDEAVFYTSGRTSNEAAFLYQLFVRAFGTNNLPDCSNMCHESSGTGLSEVIGVGKGTVTLQDLETAGLILIFGQNPGTNHPRMLTALQEAKRRGATIVSINPLKEAGLLRFKHPKELGGLVGRGTALTDHFLQVRLNGDVALVKGLAKALLELEDARPGEVLDHAFLSEHTCGFDAYAADLRAARWSDLVEGSGLDEPTLRHVADLLARHDRIIACWAMGLTQHRNGVANVQSVTHLLMLRGALGRPGAGVCPVRGHSNVQGDRTMGIWEKPPAAFLDALKARFGFEPPRAHGLDTVHAIRAMHAGRAKVFFGLGGNFLSATPDTHFTAEALRRCALTVQVSTKLNRSHLVTGRTAIILPCLGRTERDVQPGGDQVVTVENSMGVVHTSRGRRAPASLHLLSEPRIVADLAHATLGPRPVDWRALADDYTRIRHHIAAVVPGCEDYEARVQQPGGFVLPNPVRDHRTWNTATGRATFTVHDPPRHDLQPGQLLMMTVRSHDQYNTTVYGDDDRYRGLHAQRRVVLVHRDELAARGLSEGQWVDLTSHFRGTERTARGWRVRAYDVPRRTAVTYFPEANVLVPHDSTAERSHTPTSKSVVITMRPSEAPPATA